MPAIGSEPAPSVSKIHLRAESQPALTTAIVLLTAAVFVASALTPLGFAVWIFYLAPGLLCLFHRSPWLPIVVAAATSLLIVAGVFFSPSDVALHIVEINRLFGIASAWMVGLAGRRFILARLRVERESALRQGQTMLYDVLRGQRDIETLSRSVLRCACEWLDAPVGALYVSDDDGTRVDMAASYAFDAGPGRARRFHLGEGLVGQVAADARLRKVTGVPEGYVRVASGLGTATVRHLWLAPLMAGDSVCGVLELGFLDRPDPAAEEFLTRIAETVGITIRTVRDQARVAALLEQSHRQAEALQAQQEELRVVNDDLAQQTHALEESQVRMEEQQAELEQTNVHLAEQTSALEERSVELARVNRYKSDFLANMSHELRTPLNSSLIMARLLADNRTGNLSAEQVKYAETIHSSGKDLLALIDDVLDLSKVEAGRMEIRPERFAVGALLGGIEDVFGPMAAEKGLDLTVRTLDRDVELHSDRHRIEQILKNLLSNAIKFTEKGRVTLSVVVDEDSVVFEVSDTGIGIAADQMEAIFEAFRQADGTTSRKYGGTGLGLTISRQLARLLGGSIEVRSQLGEGSAFRLRAPRRMKGTELPAPPPAGSRPPSPPEPSARSAPPLFVDDRERLDAARRTVLVIEDDERFALVLCELVHQLGFQCLVALEAEEGLELARRHRPDGIVLDIVLPDHSGLVVLDALKHAPETRHIPVHVVSAEDYERIVLEMGAVAFLRKPVDRERLLATLRGVDPSSRNAKSRVLVVESDDARRETLESLIADDDVQITTVATTEQALERLGDTDFDCMVVDLSVPEVAGYDLIERMAVRGRKRPPVIVYTGPEVSREEEERLLRSRSSIVLKHARSPERLLDQVTLFLHRVEERLPRERQAMLRALRSQDRPLEGHTILLVDDDVRNVFALSSVLEERGARVRIGRNGRQALDELRQDPLVDLVLMDIMMPEMNGYEAIAAIRAQARFAGLPIIAVTAKATREDHERCLAAGANDYLAKPVDVSRLLSLVRVWMPRQARWLS